MRWGGRGRPPAERGAAGHALSPPVTLSPPPGRELVALCSSLATQGSPAEAPGAAALPTAESSRTSLGLDREVEPDH